MHFTPRWLSLSLICALNSGAAQTSLSPCEAAVNGLDRADFAAYLQIKELLANKAEFSALHNLNLAGTNYHLISQPLEFNVLPSADAISDKLAAVFVLPEELKDSIVYGRGVRELLGRLLKFYAQAGYQALIPADVYPVYGVLAKAAGLESSSYRSIPELVIPESQSRRPEVAMITSPLSPSGRSLSEHEVQSFLSWLEKNPSRRLILDTVYTFNKRWDAATERLLKSTQVVALHSMAKAWVLPGHLGFAVSLSADLKNLAEEASSLDFKLASKALAVAQQQPDLPAQLAASFRQGWESLAPQLKVIDPNWQAPSNGYLSVIHRRASEILTQHGLLTMPLSVFGAGESEWSVVSALPDATEEVYYATTLSNLVRGYDKYSGEYSKGGIPESSFPNQFFLLREDELAIGLAKARAQLDKTMPGDRMIVLKTRAKRSRLLPNERNGLGRFVPSSRILVEELFYLNEQGSALESVRLEDALADSFALNQHQFVDFAQIKPRTISILPIASACQACCKFCFSDASVSAEKRKKLLPMETIERTLKLAKSRGAERVVITGGGEPTLIGFDALAQMLKLSAVHFPGRITLITNGLKLAELSEEDRLQRLLEMDEAGLRVLAVSRHHHESQINATIMGIDTGTEKIAATYANNRSKFKNMKLRLICVLQKQGVGNEAEVENYILWAHSLGINEINFKELYVSTDRESNYVSSSANIYSEENRVYLRTILNFAKAKNWTQVGELPWGAPIFEKSVDGQTMKIAAYTEPSLFWERTHGIARSWNLMADGKLLVSLETGDSEISLE